MKNDQLRLRRKFLEELAKTSAGLWFMSSLGCGARSLSRTAFEADPRPYAPITLRDIRVMALYSDGGLGPETGIIRATDVRDGRSATLDFWDGHGHKYTVGPEAHEKIKQGKPFTIQTTVAQNHDHKVLIDLKYQIVSSQAVDITTGPVTTPTPTPPTAGNNGTGGTPGSDDKLYAALTRGDQPTLVVAGPNSIKDTSVEFCLDQLDACHADVSKWRRMMPNGSSTQFFRSDSGLVLDPNQVEIPLNIRARMVSDDRTLLQLLKLRRR